LEYREIEQVWETERTGGIRKQKINNGDEGLSKKQGQLGRLIQ
jgi:hypothetical protein